MSPGVKWGGSLIFLSAFGSFLLVQVLFGAFLARVQLELLAISLTGLICAFLAMKMHWLRRNPSVKYKLSYFGHGEMLRPSDRHTLFWIYFLVAHLLLASGLWSAWRLYSN